VGVKKSLVFYTGMPLEGLKTNWIMHEYGLAETLPSERKGSMLLDDWVLCRIYEKVSHSPMVVSCQDVEPQSPDLQRTQQKSAMHKFSSFSWLLRREGPFMESILSHPTSDASNAVVSSVESSSPAAKFVREPKPSVNAHGLNDDEVSSVYPAKKKNTLNPS
jgi:hypothetical protein